jgi:PAS domain S-box-containing protein
METKQTEHNIVKGSPSPDSPVKWLELYSYPIIDSETNQFTVVVEFVRNITERVNNREELVSQKNRLENIIEGTNAGTWEWNVQTGETIFNERWAEIIGYTLDEISPVSIETWVKYAHPDDLRKSNELLEKHLNGEIEHYTCECRMKHKDGHWVWVLDKGKVISWTEDGRPLWVFGTHQDITERKNREARIQALKEDLEAAEEEIRASNEELRDKNKKLEKQKEELQQAFDKLEESETRFKNLFHDNLAPMLVLEPETRKIIEANKAAVKFYGWDMETLLTMKIDDINILPPDKLEKTMKDIIKEDGKVYYQFQHKLANGNIRDVEVYSSKIRHKGQPYYCALIHDITERKIAEKKLQKRTEEYYTLYKEYKTQNENLLEAKERAEESDRLKSAFLANMSHEIRTPMNGIMGFSKMMQETEFPEEKQKKFLDIIHSRTQHLLQIINDIVDISKIEAHQLSIYPQKFSLNELIKELENFYKKDLHDKGKHNLQLNTNIGLSEEESIIESDPTRIRQVLDNLFSNAIKFTEEGSIVLGYSLRSDESLLFWVKDSGIGIAEKDQGKIFERFRQVHDSNNRLYEGTGLGLSISKKLTELLGGKMWVESKVNEGSVFYFTVPYVNKERATTKATASKSENPDWRGNTLLIVEDDPTSLEYLKEITKPTGARIILKETGEDGYNAYKNDPSVDIILMDLRLPDINGLEIIKRIREKDRDVKIVAQTAHAMGGDKRKCHESGADDYISKPIDASDLITVIDRFVQ